MLDTELNELIRKLNIEQKNAFDKIHEWTKSYIQNMSLGSAKSYIEPLHVFLTGNAGCGKSFLMKIIYQAVTKALSYENSTLDKPKVLILDPTGVAAINVDGTIIH